MPDIRPRNGRHGINRLRDVRPSLPCTAPVIQPDQNADQASLSCRAFPRGLSGRKPAYLDRDRDRPTRRVVRGISAGDPATAGVAPPDRVEVEPRLTGLRQSTAARRAGHRRAGAITNGEGSMAIGRGRVEHRGHLLARRGPGGALSHPRETLPHHVAERRRLDAPASAPSGMPLGCRSVSGPLVRPTSTRTDLPSAPSSGIIAR